MSFAHLSKADFFVFPTFGLFSVKVPKVSPFMSTPFEQVSTIFLLGEGEREDLAGDLLSAPEGRFAPRGPGLLPGLDHFRGRTPQVGDFFLGAGRK